MVRNWLDFFTCSFSASCIKHLSFCISDFESISLQYLFYRQESIPIVLVLPFDGPNPRYFCLAMASCQITVQITNLLFSWLKIFLHYIDSQGRPFTAHKGRVKQWNHWNAKQNRNLRLRFSHKDCNNINIAMTSCVYLFILFLRTFFFTGYIIKIIKI